MPDIDFKFYWRQNDPTAIRDARIFWFPDASVE